MAMPRSKRSPIWLARVDPEAPGVHPRYRRSIYYYRRLYQAWPNWPGMEKGFATLQRERDQRRACGEMVELDHIVPISSPIVCGLHVPWNLEIIPAGRNLFKSNHMWPGHPCEPQALFDAECEPHQLRLWILT